MTARHSAGLLPMRRTTGGVEIFLVHMAGPYWAHKDVGSWSIAKGEYDPACEDPWQVALREFGEEVGMPAPEGPVTDLGEHRMPSGKRVRVFLVETTQGLRFASSNLFSMEWPPGSGRLEQFPETDDAAWYSLEEAASRLVSGQLAILAAVRAFLGG